MSGSKQGEKPGENSRLVALVDGAALEPAAGRALWEEFSAYMEANQGDFAGFAKLKGWHKVAPEFRQGKAVLVVATAAPKGKARRAP